MSLETNSQYLNPDEGYIDYEKYKPYDLTQLAKTNIENYTICTLRRGKFEFETHIFDPLLKDPLKIGIYKITSLNKKTALNDHLEAICHIILMKKEHKKMQIQYDS